MSSAWRSQLRQATFRGVPFYTWRTESQQGRRSVLHEYPQRDVPYVEDLGRKARGFVLEAYVIGQHYMTARDNLINALEQPGPGTLVHPYRGTLNVALLTPATIIESANEGGMARFMMNFIEAGNNAQPSAKPDTASLVGNAADAANAAAQNSFANKFNIVGAVDFVTSASQAAVNSALGAINSVSQFGQGGNLLSELLSSSSNLSSSLTTLMATPQTLAGSIQSQIFGVESLFSNPSYAFSNLKTFFGAGKEVAGTPPVIAVQPASLATPSRIQQSINQAAVVDLVRRTAIIEGVRTSSQIQFASYNDALNMEQSLSTYLDTEMESTSVNSYGQPIPIDDDLYVALGALKVAMVRDITARGANLAPLTQVTLPITMPSLVAAFKVYGESTQELDFVARNNIRRPGFMPGGVPLEALYV